MKPKPKRKPGPKPLPAERKRSHRLQVPMTEDERVRLEMAAERAETTMADYAREAIRDWTESTLGGA